MTETVARIAAASVSFKEIEATAATVVKDIETILTDVSVLEAVLPPQVKAVLIEAQAVLSVVQKILADV